ncbi:MAG: hypothetical protein HY289_09025 [Planctomycetes bacterium]|nr:hypothetical protein [Planctomycetota bacterium]
MTKTPAFGKLLAGFLLLLGSVTQASAQPTPSEMLNPKLAPKFDDVSITTPTDAELRGCTVEVFKGSVPKAAGYILRDAKGQPLRRYFDSNGDNKVDMWSYYKDGVEVYREIDTTFKGLPNNFRWLNGGGMKWGVGGLDPKTDKWVISRWLMISANEAAYEAFQAVSTGKYERLEALFISDADMQALKLPAAKQKAIADSLAQAKEKFRFEANKLAGAKFDGVESAVPQCDTSNGDVEIIKHASRAVRYPTADKKFAWLQTGEMIQVGMAWRLVDAPSKDVVEPPPPPGGNDKLTELLKKLAVLDDKNKNVHADIVGKSKVVDDYYRTRIELVKEIIPLDKETELESWYKQLFDNMTAVAQNDGAAASLDALTKLKDAVAASKKFGPISAISSRSTSAPRTRRKR